MFIRFSLLGLIDHRAGYTLCGAELLLMRLWVHDSLFAQRHLSATAGISSSRDLASLHFGTQHVCHRHTTPHIFDWAFHKLEGCWN